jgi:hypothetical protein
LSRQASTELSKTSSPLAIKLAYLRPADAASDPRAAPLLKSASLYPEVDEQGRPRP